MTMTNICKSISGINAVVLLKYLAFLTVLFSFQTLCAQNAKPDLTPPEFKWKGMTIETFIKKNLRYPDSLSKKGISGYFVIQFTVDTAGSVSKVFCKDSVSQAQQGLLDEAIRVILLSDGKWKPATVNGKKAKMQMRIPIRFELAD